MTIMESIELINYAIAAYPNGKPKDKDIEKTAIVWADTLRDYSAPDVFEGLKRHIAKSKFFPTPNDLIEKTKEALETKALVSNLPTGAVPLNIGGKTIIAYDIESIVLTPEEQKRIKYIAEFIGFGGGDD